MNNSVKMKLLVIDDMLINRQIIKKIFESEYDIVEATNGMEGIEIAKKEKVDVIILDLVMPVMDGFGFLRHRQLDKDISEIPVLVITELNTPTVEVTALNLGASDLVSKPYDKKVIKTRINNIVQKHLFNKIYLENKYLKELNKSEKQLNAIFDNMFGGFCIYERKNGIARANFINKGFYDMVGYTPEEYEKFQGHFDKLIYKEDVEYFKSNLQNALKSDTTIEMVYRIIHKNGSIRWHQFRGVRIRYNEDDTDKVLAIIIDITNLKNTQSLLQETSSKLNVFFDSILGGIGIFEIGERITVKFVNDGMYNLFGYKRGEIRIEDTISHSTLVNVIKDIKKYINTDEIWNYKLEINKKNNLKGTILIRGKFSGYSQDNLPLLFVVVVDVSKEEEQNRKIKNLAEYDQATGLLNQFSFYSEVAQILEVNKYKKYIFLSVNIGQFQMITDIFGIVKATELLRRVADGIKKISDNCIVGYLGKTNFGVLIAYSNFDIKTYINKMDEYLDGFLEGYVTRLYYGIYQIYDRSISIERISLRASIAAEKIANSTIEYYNYFDEATLLEVEKKNKIKLEMETALANNEFRIHLQPVCNFKTGKVEGSEALVRWYHPIDGIIPPNEFIPVFEENGFITKLDYFVWEEACKAIRNFIDNKKEIIPISVNVSRINLYHNNFIERITGLIEKYDIPTGYLRVEITESAYTINEVLLEKVIKELWNYGIVVLMDDFGSGYSSLNMLKEVKVDILKIDMKFLQDFESNKRSEIILSSILEMARLLGMPVIAEGVETRTQADFLRENGCRFAQGYYYSKPIPVDEFEKYVIEKNSEE